MTANARLLINLAIAAFIFSAIESAIVLNLVLFSSRGW